jgi:hypothetical protein
MTVRANRSTDFLLKGKKRRPGYTDELFAKHDCKEGSTFIMTENAL